MTAALAIETHNDAAAEAARLAAAAGVEIRLLSTPAEMAEASGLFARVWQVDAGHAHVDAGLLVALAHADNYVAGAFLNDQLCAASVGFFHPPATSALHSHITGVDDAFVGGGIGKAIKFHQRAWALAHGARRMTWTFDPLIARNAYFNIHTLRTRVVSYLPDFYGAMHDGINAGQGSDRILVEWDLTDPPPIRDATRPDAAVLSMINGTPIASDAPFDATTVRVDIPEDILLLRAQDPQAAAQWRTELRAAMTRLMNEGWAVTNVSRGSYHLERAQR